MVARQVSPVTSSGPTGLRRHGRPPGSHRPTLLHIGTLALKPTLYPEHVELLAALQNPPPGLSRKQYAAQLMTAGLRGVVVAQVHETVVAEQPELDAFLDV